MSDEKSLRDDLNEMLGDAKDEVKKAADRVSEKAGEFAEEAKQAFEGAKEKASDFAGEAKESAKEFTDEAKEAYNRASGNNKKVLAGVLAIVLGGFGIHKFVLGYTKEGLILLIGTLVLGVLSFGLLAWLIWIFTLIEGIIYLTKTDEEFYNTYQVNKKPWF